MNSTGSTSLDPSASQRLSVRVRWAAGRKPKWYQPWSTITGWGDSTGIDPIYKYPKISSMYKKKVLCLPDPGSWMCTRQELFQRSCGPQLGVRTSTSCRIKAKELCWPCQQNQWSESEVCLSITSLGFSWSIISDQQLPSVSKKNRPMATHLLAAGKPTPLTKVWVMCGSFLPYRAVWDWLFLYCRRCQFPKLMRNHHPTHH